MTSRKTVKTRILTALALSSAVLASALAASRARGQSPPPPAVVHPHLVSVAAVSREPFSHPVRATGLVRKKDEAALGFLQGGQLAWVGVDVGDRVKKGQLLARLDTAQLAADADRARAAREKAERDLSRVETLERSGTLPKNDLDDAKTGRAIADAQKRAAEFALGHGVLVAPEDGVVDAKLALAGEIVGAGQPIVRLSGSARGTVVRVSLADRDVLGLAVGTPAKVTIDGAAGPARSARVSLVASAASPASGTFDVEVRLDGDAEPDLPSGLSAKVEIERTVAAASSVPVSALASGEGRAAVVFAVDGPVARRVGVHVVAFEGDRAALAEALSGFSSVATVGTSELSDGAAITVVPQ